MRRPSLARRGERSPGEKKKNPRPPLPLSSSFPLLSFSIQERRIRYPVGNGGTNSGIGASSSVALSAESDAEWAPPSPWQEKGAGGVSSSGSSSSSLSSSSTSSAVAAARGRRSAKQQQQQKLDASSPPPSSIEEVEEDKEQGNADSELLFPPSSFLKKPESEPKEKPAPSPALLPSTPAELLRLARSSEALAARAADDALLSRSYAVLDGCPWPVPRTLFFLASPAQEEENESGEGASSSSTSGSGNSNGNGGGEEGEEAANLAPPGLAFSLRVRRASPSSTNELSRLLGRNRKREDGGGPLIEISSLVDGVVAFEREEDAAAFAEQLSVSSSSTSASASTSAVGAASSHELFRATGDAKGVVVLVRRPKEEEEEEGKQRRDNDDDGKGARPRPSSLLLGPLPDPSALAAALKAGKQGELEP